MQHIRDIHAHSSPRPCLTSSLALIPPPSHRPPSMLPRPHNPAMSILRRSTRDASPTTPALSLDDFQRLVSDAFDLHRPPLSFSPAAPAHIHSSLSPAVVDSPSVKSYFEHEADDRESARRRSRSFASASASNSPRQSLSTRPSHKTRGTSNAHRRPSPRSRPRSQSFSHFHFIHRVIPGASPPQRMDAKPCQIAAGASGRVVPRVLRSLRTRASALVLRSSHLATSHATSTVAVQTDLLDVPMHPSALALTTTTSGSTITPAASSARVRSLLRDNGEHPSAPSFSQTFTFPPRPSTTVSNPEPNLSSPRVQSNLPFPLADPVESIERGEYSATGVAATEGHYPSPALLDVQELPVNSLSNGKRSSRNS